MIIGDPFTYGAVGVIIAFFAFLILWLAPAWFVGLVVSLAAGGCIGLFVWAIINDL